MTERYKKWYYGHWPQLSHGISTWHFDDSRPPEPGADSFYTLGNMAVNVDILADENLENLPSGSWARRVASEDDPEYKNSMENFLKSINWDPEKKHFDRLNLMHLPLAPKILSALGLTDGEIWLHLQQTGQSLNMHLDHLSAPDEDPAAIRRFFVMLDDWHAGQVIIFGNGVFAHWRAGDVVSFDWQNMPHGSANFSWSPRPMLQITGYVSDKTHQLFNSAGPGVKIEL